jgi:hypothetical protein
VETSFELSSLPLYRSSHTFQNLSLTGARILKNNGLTVTKSTPLDKYLSRSEDDISSWHSFICKQRKVPVISGGSLRASWPFSGCSPSSSSSFSSSKKFTLLSPNFALSMSAFTKFGHESFNKNS